MEKLEGHIWEIFKEENLIKNSGIQILGKILKKIWEKLGKNMRKIVRKVKEKN